MDVELREVERAAAGGDLSAMSRVLYLKRRLTPTGYGITRPIHIFLQDCVKQRNDNIQSYTGFHNEKEFRIRFCYGGDLTFQYEDGIVAVYAGYTYNFSWLFEQLREQGYEVLNNADDSDQLPKDLRYSIWRSCRYPEGVIVRLDEADSFHKLKHIIDTWLPTRLPKERT